MGEKETHWGVGMWCTRGKEWEWGEWGNEEMVCWNFFSGEFPSWILYLVEQVLGISRGEGGCRAERYRCKVVKRCCI